MGKTFFDTLDDSNQKIKDTVIMYGEYPCYVENIYGMNKKPVADIHILPIGKGKLEKAIPFDTDHFEIRRLPPLGYVNYSDNAFYLSRVPARQWKQGFCTENVIIPAFPDVRTPPWRTLTESIGLLHMLTNNYESFKHVLEKVAESENPISKAVSKVMALSIDDLESLTLWYKGTKIASCNNYKKYGPVFKLPKKFSYLKELCEESKIKLEAA